MARTVSNALLIMSDGKSASESETTVLLTSKGIPKPFRDLPIVDIGAHDGTDYTFPGSKLGHRVYRSRLRMRERNYPSPGNIMTV